MPCIVDPFPPVASLEAVRRLRFGVDPTSLLPPTSGPELNTHPRTSWTFLSKQAQFGLNISGVTEPCADAILPPSLPPAPIPPSASKPLSPLLASPSSPSPLSNGDAPLFAGCQLDNNCHSRGAGIYVRCVVWKKRQTHPSFSPSFPQRGAARPRAVSLYRELLSQ